MHVLSSLLALCVLSPLTLAAIAPRQSNSPCVYTCPSKDDGNRNNFASSSNSARLTCTYSSTGTRNCVYTKSNGNLFTDNDFGDCPAKASHTGNCMTRRAALPVRKISEGAQPARGKKVVMGRFNKRKN